MGRIKTRLIKRTAKRLIKDHEADVQVEFGANKKVIESKFEMNSKKLRNVLAGYVTKLKKRKR